MRFNPMHGQNRIFLFIAFAFLSCNDDSKSPPMKEDTVLIPKDTGVSISGFWMDPSEINSNEYKQYVFIDMVK